MQSLDYYAARWESKKKKIYYRNVTLVQMLLQESEIPSIRVNL